MPVSDHEKASDIIAGVIDFPPEEAKKKILDACKGNNTLYDLAIGLYEEIIADESNVKKQGNLVQYDKGFSKSRIGIAGNTVNVFGSITKILFGGKTRRLITLISLLFLITVIGFIVRYNYRKRVISIEEGEQVTMLNINYKSLDNWIRLKKDLTLEAADNSEVIKIAEILDSLVKIDPTYELINNYSGKQDLYRRLNAVRKLYKMESLSIINKRDPVFMMLTESTEQGADNSFTDLQLGLQGYEYYLKLQEKNDFVFSPPMHDRDKFTSIPEGLNEDAFCTFTTPIFKNGKVVAYLYNGYNVKNSFSGILNLAHHNESAETYAFNREGRMMSSSRFENELKNTYLLDYDSTKGSIYNIMLLDPGNNVYRNTEPEIPKIDQTYTRIVAQALDHLQRKDSVFSGVIMEPYNDYRGIKVIGAWKWFPEYDFGLIDEIDQEEAWVVLRYFDWAFFMFFGILLILTILLYNSNVKIAKFGKRIEDFSKLGQYVLVDKLGEGGFGEVYKAEHTFLKTPVAIKILKQEFIGTDMLDRFEREVKVTSSLMHPNTVRVFDYGTSSSGQFYYVMEYLNGISLDKIVNQEQNFPVDRALHVLLKCSYSLLEAHKKGLVHRDIKPMNIMVCNQGGEYDMVKILDFGLVKKVDTSISQQTKINRIGGTPMFMAPERLRDPYNTDHRVDIYALGAVGIYMLSGQYLLELISQKMLSGQETLQVDFKQHLIDRVDVPEELNELLKECVSFEPEKRPKNLEYIIEILERLSNKHHWTREKAENWWRKYDVYG